MDKGAHFFKCDFQIHSPKDKQWVGKKFGFKSNDLSKLTEEDKSTINKDRFQFAREYLDKIVNNGLNSIAITDHHDVTFAKIIRKIAKEEYNQPKKNIFVFPGIELTLSNPASQCLIIFDSEFEDSNLDSVLNFLGISPSNEFDESTCETKRISQDIIQDLVHLHKKLDELGYCNGRYIILPNVCDGGSDSILRTGFHEHYRKMPCVGGYTDKDISCESGYLNKLNGGDVNYGNKSIGIICTSDNRYEDGRLFGQFGTWIKWAEPTAEAIRQACLGKESRLSQSLPELPQIFINRIEVTNSKFLSSFVFECNQQYNAIIGGRGTGKSTILEYLRWGLCDQNIINSNNEDQSDVERKRHILIENTLVKFNGEVRITFSLNGITHIVKRNSTTKEILLKIGDGSFDQVNEEEIRRILPIQAYSQKQLSSIGIRIEELKRFIQLPIINELNVLKFQISDNAKKTLNVYNNLLRKKKLINEVDQFNLEIKSLNTQVLNLRNSLTGITEEDQKIIYKKQKFDNEQNLINKMQNEFSVISNKITELINFLKKFPEPFPIASELENQKMVIEIDEIRKNKFNELNKIIQNLNNFINITNLNDLNILVKQWIKVKDDYEKKYEATKIKTTSNQTQLNEISRIEKRLQELLNFLNERNSVLKEIGNPEKEFDELREEWFLLHQQKIDLLNSQSQIFSQLSRGMIKAEITKSIDIKLIKNQLVGALQGSRITETKMQLLCNYIISNESPLEIWKKIIYELKQLAEIKNIDSKSVELPETPILNKCDFNDGNKIKIVELLTPENWINIATTEIEFNPEFKYTTSDQMEDVIPFSDASAGQQATALLTVLLNQEGAPLIIDQPEDDIDNRAIEDIIYNIWQAKKKRQLIFTSHNANLVVNGDAELVICCDYRESDNQTRGIIKAEGAIDSKLVKDEITSVMEGGEKAFKLRKEKYGF